VPPTARCAGVDVMVPTLILALTAGMVAAINPCGFSLLPAYIGSFVSATTPMDRSIDGCSVPSRRPWQ